MSWFFHSASYRLLFHSELINAKDEIPGLAADVRRVSETYIHVRRGTTPTAPFHEVQRLDTMAQLGERTN